MVTTAETLPLGHPGSQLPREWPTDAQPEARHQITSSFDISAKVSVRPQLSFYQSFHPGSQNKKVLTYNLSIFDTNKHLLPKALLDVEGKH